MIKNNKNFEFRHKVLKFWLKAFKSKQKVFNFSRVFLKVSYKYRL